ncbi:MAG: ArnT family glycosyltransferase [Candidatus Binatia bacterium]
MYLVTLAVLCGLLFFPYLGWFPFFNKGEPREALVVQEIFLHGNWLFPLKWGEEIPSKPPLFHWFAALSSIAWGEVTEATARFPSALFATLGVLSLYFLGRSLFDPKIALLGGVILATSVGYQTQAVSARVDMTLSFFMTLSLVTFYLLYRGFLRGRLWTYGFYLILGVSVLAKGPVGLILPGMVIGAFLAMRKRWDFLSRLCFHKGVVLTLLIGISWYGMALLKGGEDFFIRQIMQENLARFFVYGEGGTGHQKPVTYYLPYLFLEGLPWSIFLPFIVIDWIKGKFSSDEDSLFLLLWVLVIFVFFSLSAGKRPVYLLPLYPPLSLLIARWFRQARKTGKITAIGLRFFGGFFAVVGLTVGALFFSLSWGKGFPSAVANMLKSKDQVGFLYVQRSFEQGGWILFAFLAVFLLFWIFLTWDLFRVRLWRIPIKLAWLSLLAWTLVQSTFIPAIAEARSYGSFMREVNRRLVEGDPLYLYGGTFDSTPLFFYRGGPIPVMEETAEDLVKRLSLGVDHVIMAEKEWQQIHALHSALPEPVLRSVGSGVDGNAPLVLIRGKKSPRSNP